MWQNDSNSWSHPTTVHRCTCLQCRPTTCADTLKIQTQNRVCPLLSFSRMKREHSKVQIRFRKGCCCHSPEQCRPACLKIKRANQIAIKRAILLFWKLDSLWWLHSVPFVRLYSVSLGVIFPDYDSLPHYMEGNMTHSAHLGSGPLQNHIPKMLFRVQFTEWCVGSWLELMAWHDFPSSWDLVCSSVTSPHVMECHIWWDAFQSGKLRLPSHYRDISAKNSWN
jgi:hypothetical protein